jgi:hypothetical protein
VEREAEAEAGQGAERGVEEAEAEAEAGQGAVVEAERVGLAVNVSEHSS